jgi:hypothetical protein
MAALSREQVSNALLNLLVTAQFVTLNSGGQAIGFVTSGRRFRPWEEVNGSQQPAIFLTEPKETHTRQELQTPAVRTIMYDAFIFINDGANKAASVTAITTLNNIADSIDPRYGGVLKPEVNSGRQTLGNLVWDCYIEGEIVKVPGDLNGQGVLVIPIKVIIP